MVFTKYKGTLLYSAFFVSVILTVISLVKYSIVFYFPIGTDSQAKGGLIEGLIVLIFIFSSIVTGVSACNLDRRRFLLINVSVFITVTLTIAVPELFLRTLIPPWPASHLHGVPADVGPQAWGRIQSLFPDAVKNNSWGQRDKERNVKKSSGSYRIAFVGDSFLEESSLSPISLLVDQKAGNSIEVVNLGISATHPLDYYYVIKEVALKLAVDEVITFIFAGNDFSSYPDQRSAYIQALMSPPPRSSLLGDILPGINFNLTRKDRFTYHAWLATNLHKHEQAKLADFQRITPRDLPRELSRFHHPKSHRKTCMKELEQKDLSEFYVNLTAPDMGLFRTYAFPLVICAPDNPAKTLSTQDIKDIKNTVGILKKIDNITRNSGVLHRVVLIPVGPDVDTRIQDQWQVLVDYRKKFQNTFSKVDLFVKSLRSESINLINLYPLFDQKGGNYLNFDGHWSTQGNEIVADYITDIIINR